MRSGLLGGFVDVVLRSINLPPIPSARARSTTIAARLMSTPAKGLDAFVAPVLALAAT